MTPEEIRLAVSARKRLDAFAWRFLATEFCTDDHYADAIARYVTGSFDPVEDEHYGQVQRAMSSKKGLPLELGMTSFTIGIQSLCRKHSVDPSVVCNELLNKHREGDWGKLDDEDKEVNDDALREGGRVLSVYSLFGEDVYVITEWDRSRTTVLLTEEY